MFACHALNSGSALCAKEKKYFVHSFIRFAEKNRGHILKLEGQQDNNFFRNPAMSSNYPSDGS